MDGFEIGEFIVVCVYADAEEEAGVSTVDDLVVAVLRGRERERDKWRGGEVGWCGEGSAGCLCQSLPPSSSSSPTPPLCTHLNKITLVLLIPRSNQSVHLALYAHLLLLVVRHVEFGQPGFALPILDEDETDHAWWARGDV